MEKNNHNIITSIGNCISKLIGVVKKNGILASTWAVLLFIILYTFVINPININDLAIKINDNKKIEHDESINKRLLADELLPEILDKLRLKFNVDRVSLMELHNSTSNINDISFLYLSLVYESIDVFDDSLQYISEQYQQQRTSDFRDVIKATASRGYLYLDHLDSCKDARFVRLARKMVGNGTNSVLFVPIYTGKRLDAMLILSSREKEFDYKNAMLNLNKPVSKIRNLIVN